MEAFHFEDIYAEQNNFWLANINSMLLYKWYIYNFDCVISFHTVMKMTAMY